MKFDTYCKWDMLIVNIVIGIDDLNPKLYIRANLVPTLKSAPIFKKFGSHNKMLIINMMLASV